MTINANPNVTVVVRPAALSTKRFRDDIDKLQSEVFDVLVIGGGIVGAGVALDAATRGLRVAIVEATDWAAGTSSQSSKLIHGGLRYLEMHDFALVREALRERSVLLRTAPHLVRAIPFIFPLRPPITERAYVGAGILLYDLLSRMNGEDKSFPFHRQLSRQRALELVPSLKDHQLIGAIQYWDGQVDDARHTVSVVRTAASYGAVVANRVRVVGFVHSGQQVVGAKVLQVESGESFDISATVVIGAGGPWTEELLRLSDNMPPSSFGGQHFEAHQSLRPSKGVHLVVPRSTIDSSSALIFRTEKSVLLVLPWGKHWLIGTTDTLWDGDIDNVAANADDIEYLLDTVNGFLRHRLTHDDIESVFVGLRPLLAGRKTESAKLSREHTVISPHHGLVLITGGKYTTYRVMAKDGLDVAIKLMQLNAGPCQTARVPLVGARQIDELRHDVARIAAMAELSTEQVEHLLGRYGSLIDEVLAPTVRDPSLLSPLGFADGYLRCEVIYAVTHEGARHLVTMERPARAAYHVGCPQ